MIHWAADKHLLLSSDYTVVAFIGLVRTATLRPQGPVVIQRFVGAIALRYVKLSTNF